MKTVAILASAAFTGVAWLACAPPQPVVQPAEVVPTPSGLAVASLLSAAPPPVDPASTTHVYGAPKLKAIDEPKAWTDPRVVAALARDCAFIPQIDTHDDFGRAPNLFKCDFGYEQTCSPDPCGGTNEACEGRCSDTCSACGGGCVNQCTRCKAACNDPACIAACATQCAECHQDCNRGMDRCASGECQTAVKKCKANIRRAFANPACAQQCLAHTRCEHACNNAKGDADGLCETACMKKYDPTWVVCTDRCEGEPGDKAKELCRADCPQNPCTSPFCSMGLEALAP